MKRFYIFILCCSLACIGASYLLFFHPITEKRYNKIMDYYIASRLTRHLATFEEKVDVIRDFVHENVHPIAGYPNRLDTVAIDKLLSGIGWCDQQSRVFMQLARPIGITSRLLFLRNHEGISPHSVVEVLTPDNRWVLVSVLYRLDLVTKDGRLATQYDIKNDPAIITNDKRVKMRARFEEKWTDAEFLSIFSNAPSYIVDKKGVMLDFLRSIPLSWIRPVVNIIQDRYLEGKRNETKDIYEFKMLKTRGYHLLGYYDKSEKLYAEIIRKSNNPNLRYKAEFYRALLLKDEGRYNNAYRYLSRLVEIEKTNPYINYLYGLRANVLRKMDRVKEAEEDLLKIKYLLRAY